VIACDACKVVTVTDEAVITPVDSEPLAIDPELLILAEVIPADVSKLILLIGPVEIDADVTAPVMLTLPALMPVATCNPLLVIATAVTEALDKLLLVTLPAVLIFPTVIPLLTCIAVEVNGPVVMADVVNVPPIDADALVSEPERLSVAALIPVITSMLSAVNAPVDTLVLLITVAVIADVVNGPVDMAPL